MPRWARVAIAGVLTTWLVYPNLVDTVTVVETLPHSREEHQRETE